MSNERRTKKNYEMLLLLTVNETVREKRLFSFFDEEKSVVDFCCSFTKPRLCWRKRVYVTEYNNLYELTTW
jgi:hypothetical protein